MSQNKNKNLVVIIILVVGLTSALGFIYNNNSQNQNQNIQTSKTVFVSKINSEKEQLMREVVNSYILLKKRATESPEEVRQKFQPKLNQIEAEIRATSEVVNNVDYSSPSAVDKVSTQMRGAIEKDLRWRNNPFIKSLKDEIQNTTEQLIADRASFEKEEEEKAEQEKIRQEEKKAAQQAAEEEAKREKERKRQVAKKTQATQSSQSTKIAKIKKEQKPAPQSQNQKAKKPIPKPSKYILVDKSNLTTYIIENGKVIWGRKNTIGISGKETPTGVFHIQNKFENHRLPTVGMVVRYWMSFYGDYGFHDSSKWEQELSPTHGCVKQKLSDMAELYHLSYINMKVVIRE